MKQVELIIHKWEADGILLIALVVIAELALITEVEQRSDDVLLLVIFKAELLIRIFLLFEQTTLNNLVGIGTCQENTSSETSLNTREVI